MPESEKQRALRLLKSRRRYEAKTEEEKLFESAKLLLIVAVSGLSKTAASKMLEWLDGAVSRMEAKPADVTNFVGEQTSKVKVQYDQLANALDQHNPRAHSAAEAINAYILYKHPGLKGVAYEPSRFSIKVTIVRNDPSPLPGGEFAPLG